MKRTAGWRENGEAIRALWRERVVEGVSKYIPPEVWDVFNGLPKPPPDHMWTMGASDPELNDEFVNALHDSSKDDMSPLAAYLDSEQPLGPKERKRLARFLPKGRSIGRPQNSQLRAAAALAWHFYNSLRALNKKRGFKDRGYCNDMKDYAARAMLEDWFAWGADCERLSGGGLDDFVFKVRELMEKAKSRRDPGDLGIVTFPVPDAFLKGRQKS